MEDINVTNTIESALIKQNKSQKTGNEYKTLNLTFANGYTQRFFINDAEAFAIKESLNA